VTVIFTVGEKDSTISPITLPMTRGSDDIFAMKEKEERVVRCNKLESFSLKSLLWGFDMVTSYL
jgi:acetone carboxylase gamma subunit